ncbi:MAG: hypothetical protein M3R69_11800 [Acidobacteriota bacterium]|nr:hypothetical protein [Acidobacteriota bacterium]
MSKIQHDVLVALIPEARQCPADRWTIWARSMGDRHERIAARQGVLIMTLAYPFRMFTSINQRLEKFALGLFPRIQVSIGPILQNMARSQMASLPAAQQALAFPRVTVLENRVMLEGRAPAVNDRHQPQPGFLLPASMAFATGPAGLIKSHDAAESGVIAEESRALQDFSNSPLRRIFARFHAWDPGVVLKNMIFENESPGITQRVVQKHLRVEQRKREDMVVRRQAISGASADEHRIEAEAQFASTAKTRGRSWPEKSPEINVEQLTEQVIRKIDHRITAYRERLGRAY